MKRRLRRATFLLLLSLGALGLVASGSGVWGASPWPWLAVLGLAVLTQVAGDHYDQRLRLARRTERRLNDLQEGLSMAQRQASDFAEALRKDLDEHRAVITPAGIKHLHEVVELMAKDVGPLVEEWRSVKNSGGLAALLRQQR